MPSCESIKSYLPWPILSKLPCNISLHNGIFLMFYLDYFYLNDKICHLAWSIKMELFFIPIDSEFFWLSNHKKVVQFWLIIENGCRNGFFTWAFKTNILIHATNLKLKTIITFVHIFVLLFLRWAFWESLDITFQQFFKLDSAKIGITLKFSTASIENLKNNKKLDPLGQAWQNGNALAA